MSADVDAAREALYQALLRGDEYHAAADFEAAIQPARAFEAAIRAEAEGLDDVCSPYYERGWKAGHERGRAEGLDEARVAVADCSLEVFWREGKTPLAAIDALREGA